jgi:hypothetical protein
MSRVEWSNPRTYLLPRNLTFTMPEGWAWAGGGGRRSLLEPRRPPWLISWALWPAQVVADACAVLVVGAVRMELDMDPTSSLWPTYPDLPRMVKTRKPTIELLPREGGLLVSARETSRHGEVWCWPLRRARHPSFAPRG